MGLMGFKNYISTGRRLEVGQIQGMYLLTEEILILENQMEVWFTMMGI